MESWVEQKVGWWWGRITKVDSVKHTVTAIFGYDTCARGSIWEASWLNCLWSAVKWGWGSTRQTPCLRRSVPDNGGSGVANKINGFNLLWKYNKVLLIKREVSVGEISHSCVEGGLIVICARKFCVSVELMMKVICIASRFQEPETLFFTKMGCQFF